MDHKDHVELLRAGVPASGGVWADLGAGAGAFTLALADLLGSSGTIYAVDNDGRVLNEQAKPMRDRFPNITVHYLRADFTNPLELPPLDGIVMANSLHFIRHKDPVLKRVYDYLKPDGRVLMVEYDADSGNPWVPYPFSYRTWEKMSAAAGFRNTRQIGLHSSRHLNGIYSALSFKPAAQEAI